MDTCDNKPEDGPIIDHGPMPAANRMQQKEDRQLDNRMSIDEKPSAVKIERIGEAVEREKKLDPTIAKPRSVSTTPVVDGKDACLLLYSSRDLPILFF